MTGTVADALLVAGSVLILLAAVGVTRFHDVLARMHALSKASTLGLVLVLLGGAVGLQDVDDVTFLVLAGALQVVTSPVGTGLLARATYRAGGIPHRVDTVDELRDPGSPAAAPEEG